MPRFFPLVIATLAGTATCSAVRADLVNGSFEFGFVTSSPIWSDYRGIWDVASGWNGDGGPYEPVPGPGWRAGPSGILPWLGQVTPSDGQWFGVVGSWLYSDPVRLEAGQRVLFDIGVLYDGQSFDRTWLIELWDDWNSPSALSTLITLSENQPTGGSHFTGWTTMSIVVPRSGDFTLSFDTVLGTGFAYGLIDNIRVVPAPGAAAVLGLVGVSAAGRRRR